MGGIVSNMFSSASLDADPYIFQTVDMSLQPGAQTLTPPQLYTSSSSTRAVSLPHPSSSASKPKPTMSQAINELFQKMPSPLQRDMREFEKMYVPDSDAGSDDEETNMPVCNVCFTVLNSISIPLSTMNRTRNLLAKETCRS